VVPDLKVPAGRVHLTPAGTGVGNIFGVVTKREIRAWRSLKGARLHWERVSQANDGYLAIPTDTPEGAIVD
jgi:hypothetical protein